MLSKFFGSRLGPITATLMSAAALLSQSAVAKVNDQAINLPEDDKILFFMGQDTDTLREYNSEVLNRNTDMPLPGGVTLYTSILPSAEDPSNTAPAGSTVYVSGIEGEPADEKNGAVNFQQTLSTYDAVNGGNKVALAVGLYLSNEFQGREVGCGGQHTLRAVIGKSKAVEVSGNINAGDDVGEYTDPSSDSFQWNQALRRMIRWFRDEGRPVFLRIGYEFDGEWNCYSQDYYKAAFIRIKDIINEEGASNVSTVWQAATYPQNGSAQFNQAPFPAPEEHYRGWYPTREDGTDDVVDWVGISFFYGESYRQYQWSCPNQSPNGSPRELQDTLVKFARDRTKPVMIAESAPQGFNLKTKTASCVSDTTNVRQLSSGQEIWDAFFVDYFNWIESNREQVRAVAYINTDWQSQERWNCALGSSGCSAGYWGITSIQDDETILNNFKSELKKPIYVNGEGNIKPRPTQQPTSIPVKTPTPQATSTPAVTPTPTSTQAPNNCPVSHPVSCGASCYESTAQALSAGCSVDTKPTPTPVATAVPTIAPTIAPTAVPTVTPTPEPNNCPASHPLSCGGGCYEDAAQALSAGCSVTSTPTPLPTAEPTTEPTTRPTAEPTPSPIATTAPVTAVASVNVNNSGDLGNYLIAGQNAAQPGFTLYTFTRDNAGQSVCNGRCAEVWPPYIVEAASDVNAPAGVTGLGVQTRQDGTLQLTLNSEPLYFFAQDTQPGDTNGHGRSNNAWLVADIPTPEFADATWENAALIACSDLYQGNIPRHGYHTFIEGNQLVFNAGDTIANKVWGNDIRAVFFRTNETTGKLEHTGTFNGTRNGDSARIDIPSELLQGKVSYYASFQRFYTPMSDDGVNGLPGKVGNALQYSDTALYALNRNEGCQSSNWSSSNVEDFAGWSRRQHPQGVFNDHNVFAKNTDSLQNSATHFMNAPRFVVKVVNDKAGEDLIFNVKFTYESESPFSGTEAIIWSAVEGSEKRAGDGSPRHADSNFCETTADSNEVNCNFGKNYAYGQSIDWELRLQPINSNRANLYSQMFYYVPGHGWARESSDPRALLAGKASIDAHGATVYERAGAFMQHHHTSSLKEVRDFVRQHQDLRDPIGTPVHGAEFTTCESCHINDGRSNAVFTLPSGAQRIAPPLIGLGLLEQVVDFPGKVGFGWEGNRTSVEDAVRFALKADFDVANPSADLVDKLTTYSKFVAVPQRDKSKMFEPSVIEGEKLFKGKMQCSSCHQETQQLTNGDVIRPYSDLKTHDLGSGLFRTAPLWGIGRAANVVYVGMEWMTEGGTTNAAAAGLAQRTLGNSVEQLRFLPDDQGVLFMHDGSAKSLADAIDKHNGEGSSSRAAFNNASSAEQEQLLEFLRSL